MTALCFVHEGWDVLTSSWTAASDDGKSVELCYQLGADGVSLFSSATGIRRVTLPMTMREFWRVIASHGSIVDLTGLGDLR